MPLPETLRRLVLAISIFNATRMLTGALHVVYLISNGITLAQIAYLQIAYSITALLVEYPSGYIADKWSRKNVVLLGIAMTSAFYVIAYVRPTFNFLVVSEVLYAMGLAAMSGSFEGWVRSEARRADLDYRSVAHRWLENQALYSVASATIGVGLAFATQNLAVVYIISAATMLIPMTLMRRSHYEHEGETLDPQTNERSFLEQTYATMRSKSWQTYTIVMCLFAGSMQVVYHFWQPVIIGTDDPKTFFESPLKTFLLSLVFSATFLSQWLANKYARSLGPVNYGVTFSLALSSISICIAIISGYNDVVIARVIFSGLLFVTLHGLASTLMPFAQAYLSANVKDENFSSAFSGAELVSRIAAIGVLVLVSMMVGEQSIAWLFTIPAVGFLCLAAFCRNMNAQQKGTAQ